MTTAVARVANTPRLERCAGCGVDKPVSNLVLDANGPICRACEMEGDARQAAVRQARARLTGGAGLWLAGLVTAIPAILLSGVLPWTVATDGTASTVFALAAFAVCLSGIGWGAWALITGGGSRVPLSPLWRGILRAAGGATAMWAGALGLGVAAVQVLRLL